MRKNAQGLSITTIIVAAIALIVLVVLISIFTGRFGLFSAGVSQLGDATKNCAGAAPTGQSGEFKDKCGPGEIAIASKPSSDSSKPLCCKART